MTATPATPALKHPQLELISPGTPVHVQYRKHDGQAHWSHLSEYLGADEFGHWVGARPGTLVTKPGKEVAWKKHWVILFPHDARFTMNVNEQGDNVPTRYYCDITTVPTWHQEPQGLQVHMVDMDLDVVVYADFTLRIEDEDEFEEHQTRYGYDQELIEQTTAACELVHTGFAEGAEPFTTAGVAWLDHWLETTATR